MKGSSFALSRGVLAIIAAAFQLSYGAESEEWGVPASPITASNRSVLPTAVPDYGRVIERGPHQRVVEREDIRIGKEGEVIRQTNRFTVLGNGMHVRDAVSGEWIESRPEIKIAADGSIRCSGASYEVRIAADIATVGSVEILGAQTDPNALRERVRMNLIGIGWFDPDSGRSITLSTITNSLAEVSSNQVIFRNAGHGARFSVVYRYEAARFSQWIIIEENLTPPASFGPRTRLEAYTQLVDSPTLKRKLHTLRKEADPAKRARSVEPDLTTEEIVVGSNGRFISGHAFGVNGETANLLEKRTVVQKRILEVGSRQVLVESVELSPRVRSELQKLPARTAASTSATPSQGRTLPAPLLAQATDNSHPAVLVADASQPSGFALDYEYLAGWLSDYVFEDGERYLIDYYAYVVDPTFQGGACIMTRYGSGLWVASENSYFQGPTDKYIIFTSSKDETAPGGAIDAGTPSRSDGYYGLYVDGVEYFYSYKMGFRYKGTGLYLYGVTSATVSSTAFSDCDTGVYAESSSAYVDGSDMCNVDVWTDYDEYGYASTGNITQCSSDLDGDGWADSLEMQYFGVLSESPNTDFDRDGCSNGYELELDHNTDPRESDDFDRLPLGRWRFNSGYWATDEGRTPFLTAGLDSALVGGVESYGVDLNSPSSPYKRLVYREWEPDNGQVNIALRKGTVRFWFKPSWSSVTNGGTGPGADISACIYLGLWNSVVGCWYLGFTNSGDAFNIAAQDGYNTAQLGWTTIPGGLISNQWYQFTLTYSPTNIAFYLNGNLVGTGAGLNGILPSTEWQWGIPIGSDYWGGNRAQGTYDLMETFNYELSASEVQNCDSDGDGLTDVQEVRQYGTNPMNPDCDGDSLPDGWEVACGLNPLSADNPNSDYDGDGLSNLVEYQQKLHPTNPDTNGDGVMDQVFKVAIRRPSGLSIIP